MRLTIQLAAAGRLRTRSLRAFSAQGPAAATVVKPLVIAPRDALAMGAYLIPSNSKSFPPTSHKTREFASQNHRPAWSA